ncbi:O-antigen polysaccharide polymerase Wzy family protein [Paraclostridium ghonii]|uniref:Oligosaccharide repeat unit polymerase n=1 Tax=Paraclostridium ghonii TaxID=29358 RepID=A0ABU0MW76_9FIRM|nr:O-antigen polysaccharide polymerase Wzy family protein [Paeniclostridium ghonii]MDQ0555150.1 oligosaccharide repeat unit polymerase [Paeniclostridium ghonii]
MKKSIVLRSLFILLALLLFLIGVIFKSIEPQMIAILLILINNIQYTIKDFKNNVVFFSFNITFFIFLIGRIFVSFIFGYKANLRGSYGLDFNDFIYINAITVCLFISLLSLFIGYVVSKKFKLNLKIRNKKNEVFMSYIRKFSLVFYYFCIIFRLIMVWEMKEVAISEGYFETFTTFKSSLPSILQMIANMYDVALFSYLATMPTKRKSIIPISLYIIEGGIAAIGGRRSMFMLNILIIFIYYITRNALASNYKEKWFKKFEWTISLVSLPLIISAMTIIGEIRASYSSRQGINSILENILEFFYSQGVSVNLIGYTEVYRQSLPSGKIYTFGPIMEFINNSIIRKLNGLPELTGQSVERAVDGFLYSQALPYLIMPVAYLKGYGYGSSFVAENFADLSYFGVVIGSVFYGVLIYMLTNMLKSSNFIVVTFTLLMVRAILFAPRAAYLSFIVSAFTPSKVAGIILIYIVSKLWQCIDYKKEYKV